MKTSRKVLIGLGAAVGTTAALVGLIASPAFAGEQPTPESVQAGVTTLTQNVNLLLSLIHI